MSTNVRVRVTPDFVTVSEAALLRRCSAGRIRAEIAAGTLPAVRRWGTRGHWLIPIGAIETGAARGPGHAPAGGPEHEEAR